ncbi:hypothetical protein RvY_17284-2 [Ramazzottius varieornatus]|nr:hypothetical protein RvY_17284-2 [Ramazzottius varieornatus]
MILTDRSNSLQLPTTPRNPHNMPLALRGTHGHRSSDTEHLPAIVKAHNNVFYSENADHGEWDLRKMYEKWRTGLSEYQVARLCRLDHPTHTRLPALPETLKNANGNNSGGDKRRLSQHRASSPPIFRLKVTAENGPSLPGQTVHAGRNDLKMQPPAQRKPLNPRSTKPPANRTGRFDKIVRIGNGSYGNVFRCVDRDTGAVVAVKRFLQTEDNPMIRKVACREIRTLKLLRHPNIVSLLEVFRRKKRFHLIFEYCDRSLLDEIQTTRNG